MCLFSWFHFYFKSTDQGNKNLLSTVRCTIFVNIYLKLAMQKKKKRQIFQWNAIYSHLQVYISWSQKEKSCYANPSGIFCSSKQTKSKNNIWRYTPKCDNLQSVSNSFFFTYIYIVFLFSGSTVNAFSILWYVMNHVTYAFKSAHKPECFLVKIVLNATLKFPHFYFYNNENI